MLAEFFATPKQIKHWPMISKCSIWMAKKCSWQTAWAGNTSPKPVNNLTIQEGWPRTSPNLSLLLRQTSVPSTGSHRWPGLPWEKISLSKENEISDQERRRHWTSRHRNMWQLVETCKKNLWRAQEHVFWLSAQLQICERLDTIMWSLPRSRADTSQGNPHERWSSRTSVGECRLQSVLVP